MAPILGADKEWVEPEDKPKTGSGTHDDPVRYSFKADTPEERKTLHKRNMEQFRKDAQAGKVLSLSDLICGAENVHMDNYNKMKNKQEEK